MAGRGRPKKNTIQIKVPESEEFVSADIVDSTIVVPEIIEEKVEEESLIAKEVRKFEQQVAEIQDALESISLKGIADVEERLKAINSKITAQLKLPQLLNALDELKNKDKIRKEAIKGNKSFSPLEDGTLDDDED